MTVKGYEKRIKEACQSVGTMQPAFEGAIKILAEILEQREKVYKQYIAEGAQPIFIRTLDRGNQNPAKNPLLVTWQELNAQALTYLDSLGLTAKGLRKIKDREAVGTKETSFEAMIREMEEKTRNEE